MATLANRLFLRSTTKHFSRIVRASRSSLFSCEFNSSFVNCLASSSSRNMSDSKAQRCLDMATINPCIKTMEYAVRWGAIMTFIMLTCWLNKMFIIFRGPLVIRAAAIEKELEQVKEEDTYCHMNIKQFSSFIERVVDTQKSCVK